MGKIIIKIFVLLGVSLMLSGCVKATLAWADLKPKGQAAMPELLSPPSDMSVTGQRTLWENTGIPKAREDLQRHVYGMLPDRSDTQLIKRDILDTDAFGGRGRLEELTLRASATFNDKTNTSRDFLIELILPNKATGPVPVIIIENFSPRWVAVRHPKVSRPDGVRGDMGGIGGGIAQFIFGRYVATPPIATILDRGYGVAIMYPSEFVPDSAVRGLDALRALSNGHEDPQTRWGAIAAWAWGMSRTIDILETDDRIADTGIVAYGHSRYGKAALVAGAFDDRIDAVIAHQSGTGGASLSRRKKGESVKEITSAYPHWFSQSYANYAGRESDMPIDQHFLLALLAPRPVLLGNARRDVWSDPNGALKAAIGADPIWKLYDPAGGLQQQRLKPFIPEADISLWMRPGTHGVVKEDWPAFLNFLDAHL